MVKDNLVEAVKCIDSVNQRDRLLELLGVWDLEKKHLQRSGRIRDYWCNNKICIKGKVAYYLMSTLGI